VSPFVDRRAFFENEMVVRVGAIIKEKDVNLIA